MLENTPLENEKRMSEVIFALLPENNIVLNRAFLYAFKGNFLKASMLSRYTHCFIKNNNHEITYKDKTFEDQYYCSEISVKRAKKELKDEGFITVVQKGIPAVGYITVNIEKTSAILGNFKKCQNDTTGNINLTPLTIDNKINNNKININAREEVPNHTSHNIYYVPDDNPASGSLSSSSKDSDDPSIELYDVVFEDFWKDVQYKSKKTDAYVQWKKLTNNSKSQKTIKEVKEGYERYISFLAKERARGFKDRQHMEMGRFLNPKNLLWKEEWKTEQEQIEERKNEKPTFIPIDQNTSYWDDKTDCKKQNKKEPENWRKRFAIAVALGLIENVNEEKQIKEYRYLQASTKSALESQAVENAIKNERTKDDTIIYQKNCVTVLGPSVFDIVLKKFGKERAKSAEAWYYETYDKEAYAYLVQEGSKRIKNIDVPFKTMKDVENAYLVQINFWRNAFKNNEAKEDSENIF